VAENFVSVEAEVMSNFAVLRTPHEPTGVAVQEK
jgi:hypothetical protein